jgi:uncharacterized protein YcaQ
VGGRESLSLGQARRIALAAQGFAIARPAGRIDRRHLRRVLTTLGVVQIDSVNVVTRAHELAFFARLGAYDRRALAAWLHDSGEVFEYWAHEASFLPVDDHALLRWRMTAAAEQAWGGVVRLMRESPEYLDEVRAAVRERGPITPADITEPGQRRKGTWWSWHPPKVALEALFWSGEVTAVRDARFHRRYDLPERVLPAHVIAAPTPAEDDARRALVRRAVRALGVGTARDLADYHRQGTKNVGRLLPEMVADGDLVEVAVEGWKERAYLDPQATVPRAVTARALLSPFDSVVWERQRAERPSGSGTGSRSTRRPPSACTGTT